MDVNGHPYDLFSQACVDALRLQLERAEAERDEARKTLAHGYEEALRAMDRSALVAAEQETLKAQENSAAAEERVATLAPFVEEIAKRPCRRVTCRQGRENPPCDSCRARALASPGEVGTRLTDEVINKCLEGAADVAREVAEQLKGTDSIPGSLSGMRIRGAPPEPEESDS
jgi:hypothetical protein